MRRSTVLRKYAATILLFVVIWALCLITVPEVPMDLPMTNLDKLVHALMFLAVSGVAFFDSTNHLKSRISMLRILWSALIYPLIFGGSIEIVQSFTASRTGDWMDFLFDGVGAFCGLLVCLIINKKMKNERKHQNL